MTPHREEYLELCAGYVLGSLEPSERATLEAHLASGCPECESELARLTAGAFALASSVPSQRAPAHLKARILGAVQSQAAQDDRDMRPAPAPIPLPRPRRGAPRSWSWAIAAAVLLALIGVTWQVVGRLEKDLANTRSQMAELQKQLDEEKVWLDLLESPQSRVVELHATPDGSPNLAARVIFDPASRRALVMCDRFTAPIGKDYQLWAIAAGGPASLGLVRADAAGHAVIKLTNVGDPSLLGAFAVSLEREGGSPTPTAPAGPVVMLGKLGG